MRRFALVCTMLSSMLPLGCACRQGASTITDDVSFPPGRYGLFETSSGELVLTHELAPGESFGFEYIGKRPTALSISRRTDAPDGRRTRVWRLPLSPTEYAWRPLKASASDVPSVRVAKR